MLPVNRTWDIRQAKSCQRSHLPVNQPELGICLEWGVMCK